MAKTKKMPLRLPLEEVVRLEKAGELARHDWKGRAQCVAVYDGRIYHLSWMNNEYIYIGDKYQPSQ